MLDFQIRMTTAEGAGIGLPYVSHDIGSFQAQRLPLGHVRPLGSVRRLPADPAPALRPRRPAALGVRRPRGADRERLPAAARGAGPLPLHGGARGLRHRPADRAADVPRLAAGGSAPTGSTASTCSATSCSSPRSPSPARAPTKRVWFPPGELGRRLHRGGPRTATAASASGSRSTGCRSSPGRARSSPASPIRRCRGGQARPAGDRRLRGGRRLLFDLYEDAGRRLRLPARPASRARPCAGARAPPAHADDRARARQLRGHARRSAATWCASSASTGPDGDADDRGRTARAARLVV